MPWREGLLERVVDTAVVLFFRALRRSGQSRHLPERGADARLARRIHDRRRFRRNRGLQTSLRSELSGGVQSRRSGCGRTARRRPALRVRRFRKGASGGPDGGGGSACSTFSGEGGRTRDELDSDHSCAGAGETGVPMRPERILPGDAFARVAG